MRPLIESGMGGCTHKPKLLVCSKCETLVCARCIQLEAHGCSALTQTALRERDALEARLVRVVAPKVVQIASAPTGPSR